MTSQNLASLSADVRALRETLDQRRARTAAARSASIRSRRRAAAERIEADIVQAKESLDAIADPLERLEQQLRIARAEVRLGELRTKLSETADIAS